MPAYRRNHHLKLAIIDCDGGGKRGVLSKDDRDAPTKSIANGCEARPLAVAVAVVLAVAAAAAQIAVAVVVAVRELHLYVYMCL
jgi:hypothetical protein